MLFSARLEISRPAPIDMDVSIAGRRRSALGRMPSCRAHDRFRPEAVLLAL